MLGGLKRLSYPFSRSFIKLVARPRIAGTEQLPENHPQSASEVVYVLENRSLSDLIVLDLVCEQSQRPNPLSELPIGTPPEARRFVCLNRPAFGLLRRNTMLTYSERLRRLLTSYDSAQLTNIHFVPVVVLWGRAPNREGSIWRLFVSENWAVTSRLRRFLNFFLNRRDIVVHFGSSMPLAGLTDDLTDADHESGRTIRRAARLLRVKFRNQRISSLGPDFSHQRTLVDQIIRSRGVRAAFASVDPRAESEPKILQRLEKRARKNALEIASHMSYPWIRILERLLTWVWNKMYDGIRIHGLDGVVKVAETHTLIYTPAHRSHLDYLLLSYLLFQRGLTIPHIVAGDNLDLPIVGGILRRAGAFFMRRSFKDDPIYGAVFSEYLYQAYRRGHSVEFFVEGGRSRTGRLLPPKLGLLAMTLAHNRRGVPRPLAIVPVYFGYEKLVEADSYLDELTGQSKQKESLSGLLGTFKLLRQNFGTVDVSFGAPVDFDTQQAGLDDSSEPSDLGREIVQSINNHAVLNPVNLVALVTLCTPRLAIERRTLEQQIHCYIQLISATQNLHNYVTPALNAVEIIDYVQGLGLLQTEDQQFGAVVTHSPANAILMTWYRNNVSHCLALPALIAALVIQRRRPLPVTALREMVTLIFPYLAQELSIKFDPAHIDAWLDVMTQQQLLRKTTDHDIGYLAPPTASQQHHQLFLLSQVVSTTLQRMYIVIALLDSQTSGVSEPLDRDSLLLASQLAAQKMSRLYGLNAPEFFDNRLFNQFIDRLIAEGAIQVDGEHRLHSGPQIGGVLKNATTVIDAEFRHAVVRGG